MHSFCFQSFGTNGIGAKEKKVCGICENISCNICIFLSGSTVVHKNLWLAQLSKMRALAAALPVHS